MDQYYYLYEKYSNYTIINRDRFVRNLIIAELFQSVDGAVIECGTWRGGMIASMAELMGSGHDYYLFDSFEGLPPVQQIDGNAAAEWQKNTGSSNYYDNCSADITFAEEAMKKSKVQKYTITKGWFNETLTRFCENVPSKIAILRLDADWYDSTTTCLNCLYPLVVEGGVIIIDDYYTWDGCTRAVHDYLSCNQLCDRILQLDNDVCYLVKGWTDRG